VRDRHRVSSRQMAEHEALIAALRANLPANAPSPASEREVLEAEQHLGFALHPLVRRLYLEVGNGGWGPEHGAPGLIGGARPDLPGDGAVAWYSAMRKPDPDDPTWPGWPHGLFPVTHWGCAIWSCVDCILESGEVVRFDPNVAGTFSDDPWRGVWLPESPSLSIWLAAVVDGDSPFELPASAMDSPWRARPSAT
jgi:hypothetical protein